MSRNNDTRWMAFLAAVMAMMLLPALGWAAFGEDMEKPRPEFFPEADGWVAKLVPRGKSSKVQIRFTARGANLEAPVGVDFETAVRPEVDVKDFRSALFSLHMTGVLRGGEIPLTLGSTYFNTSTQLWVFNPKAAPPWADMGAAAVRHEDRICDLTVLVRDGGPLDADGAADGQISVVVAPRDSFWGYALGTLLIRFFGIFIVLSILMAGMILSGKVFRRLEKEVPRPAPAPVSEPPKMPAGAGPGPETAAAVAVALYLQQNTGREPAAQGVSAQGDPSGWAQFGRGKMMTDRMPVFDRMHTLSKSGWSR